MKCLKVLAVCCLGMFVLGAFGGGLSKASYAQGIFSKKSKAVQKNQSKAVQKDFGDYRKACEESDFGKAHEILNELRDVFVKEGLPKAYYCEVSEIKGYRDYVDADIYIFREEVTYLMGLNDPAAESRILKLIMETPLDGRRLDEGYCSAHDAYERSVTGGEKVWLYSYCIKRNNQKCDIVMDLSILNEKQSIAKKVLLYYKDNMHIQKAGHDYSYDDYKLRINIKGKTIKVDGDHGYIWYDSEDKDAAQKRYNDAVKNGVFKK